MGHIEKRGVRRWRARYRAPNGKERSKTFPRRAEAERFLAEVRLHQLHGQVPPSEQTTTLDEFWQRLYSLLAGRLQLSTLNLYQSHWNRYIGPALGRAPIGRLTRREVEIFLAHLQSQGVRAPTVRAVMGLLRRILSAAVDSELANTNVAAKVPLPRLEYKETAFLSPGELRQLVMALPSRWKAFVLVAALGGLRFGEVSALRIERIDWSRSQIRVEDALNEVNGKLHCGFTKTRQKRAVTLPMSAMEALKEHIARFPPDEGGFVFTAEDGGLVRRSNFRKRVWLPALSAAGLKSIRFHDLRHTAAALAIAVGAHPKALQARLGHSTITMTLDRYGHLYENLDREIAVGLDSLLTSKQGRSEPAPVSPTAAVGSS